MARVIRLGKVESGWAGAVLDSVGVALEGVSREGLVCEDCAAGRVVCLYWDRL